jgi:hypothetical protein
LLPELARALQRHLPQAWQVQQRGRELRALEVAAVHIFFDLEARHAGERGPCGRRVGGRARQAEEV